MPKPKQTKRYCKGCFADVSKEMICFCGEFKLNEETLSPLLSL